MDKFSPEIQGDFPADIIQKEDGWYWADEGYEYFGPYATEKEAITAQSKYASALLSKIFI